MPLANSTEMPDRVATRWLQPRALCRCAVLALLIVFCSPAISQIDHSAYRDSTVDEVITTLRLPVGSSDRDEAVAVLLPPEFKYRLKVDATGNIRQLTPDSAAALSDWGKSEPGLPGFLKEYTHEVEVTANGKPIWLLWQRSLVAPFRAERSNGGMMDVYVICAGAFRGRLLLLVTAFESSSGAQRVTDSISSRLILATGIPGSLLTGFTGAETVGPDPTRFLALESSVAP